MTKKSYNFFLWIIYTATILTSINSTGMMNFYILLELMMLMFLYISMMKKNMVNIYSMSEKIYYYLVVQTMSSIILLILVVVKDSTLMSLIDINFLTMMLLMFKMGLYPFSFWMYKLTMMNNKTFFMMIMLQKFPLLIIMELMSSEKAMLLMILNMLMGSLYLLFNKNLKEILISSSLYTTFWMYLFINSSMILFLMYYTLYFMSVSMMINKEEKLNSNIYPIIFYLMSVGLPPMGPFFLKFEMMMNLLMINLFLKILLFVSLLISLIGYTWQFMKYMTKKYSFIMMKDNKMKMIYYTSFLCLFVSM